MKSLIDLYGMAYEPNLGTDAVDETTGGILDIYNRNQAYDNSSFGQFSNWIGRQKQKFAPNAMTDNASTGEQAAEAGSRIANMLPNLALDGLQSANNWMGASAFPEKLRTEDMLAPLGASAMVAPFMPRFGAVKRGADVTAETSPIRPGMMNVGTKPEPVFAPELFERGVPMRVYHGTDTPIDFDTFNRPPWMTEVPEIASGAAYPEYPAGFEHLRRDGKPRIFPLEVAPENPYIVNARSHVAMQEAAERYGYKDYHPATDPHDYAASKGHDFFIYDNAGGDFGVNMNHKQIVPLKPNTVRSATNGETLYSNNPRASLPGLFDQELTEPDRNAMLDWLRLSGGAP